MNPKKQKVKDRRRARKLAEEAWEAVEEGNLDLAEKIIRRAATAQVDNPVLWADQGQILNLREKPFEAADAFRTALSLAPTFADAYDHLAALRFRLGFTREAVLLQIQAVKHAPENVSFAERLEAYRSVAGEEPPQPEPPPTPQPMAPPAKRSGTEWQGRLLALDWDSLGDRLTQDGCVHIPGLMDASTCANLRDLFDHEELFAKTIVMDRPDFGEGVYRYFRTPIPFEVDQLRRAMYPHVARVANRWQELLGEAERHPPEWEGFREECAHAGQSKPTPILLKYGPGGFNALHRDLRGEVFFPIQMAVVLSPQASPSIPEGFQGGEFLFCDVPERKKSRRRAIVAGLGDALLFCTRDRLVNVGGTHGLQPVKHGVAPITAGERLVLGVPFHDYR
jgi:uncharacterized protein